MGVLAESCLRGMCALPSLTLTRVASVTVPTDGRGPAAFTYFAIWPAGQFESDGGTVDRWTPILSGVRMSSVDK
jgi:hypothetical protein